MPTRSRSRASAESRSRAFSICSASVLLQPRLDREDPALGHERGDRLPRVFGVEPRGLVLHLGRSRHGAHAAPEVDLPRGEQADALRGPRSRRSSCRRRAPAFTCGHSGEFAAASYAAAGIDASGRDRRSELYAIASLDQRVERGLVERASQLSATVRRRGLAVQCSGSDDVRQRPCAVLVAAACPERAARDDRRSSARQMAGRALRMASVQLEDQVVRVRADAQDHLAQDVQELRRAACRSRRRPRRRRRGKAPCRWSAMIELHRESLRRRR